MVFQDPDDQLFMPTVYDDVAFGPLNLGLPPQEVERRVADALQRVEALHLKDRPPYRLSGGEKRAVAIKALPEGMAHDAERVARLEREARALASVSYNFV